jgi:putative spermidine/putrescine transport system permease protein
MSLRDRTSAAIVRALEPGLLLLPGLCCLAFAFFLPVGLLLAYSLYEPTPGGRSAVGLGQYARFFEDAYYLGVMGRTFRLAFLVTLICLLMGFPIAYIMARAKPRLAIWLGILVIMPLMVSVVIRTFGWMVLMGRGGFLSTLATSLGLEGRSVVFMRTETGMVIALAQVLLPFMVLTLYGVVARVERELEEAARTMGSGFFGTLWRVTIPLSLPGVISGSLLVFALSISSFITPSLVGGVRLPVLAGSIYQQALVTVDWPFAAAQAVILLGTVLLIIVPYTMLTRRGYS